MLIDLQSHDTGTTELGHPNLYSKLNTAFDININLGRGYTHGKAVWNAFHKLQERPQRRGTSIFFSVMRSEEMGSMQETRGKRDLFSVSIIN